jgi:hypothetical protein
MKILIWNPELKVAFVEIELPIEPQVETSNDHEIRRRPGLHVEIWGSGKCVIGLKVWVWIP